eukprot:2912787-Rhodomonas_salina.1
MNIAHGTPGTDRVQKTQLLLLGERQGKRSKSDDVETDGSEKPRSSRVELESLDFGAQRVVNECEI